MTGFNLFNGRKWLLIPVLVCVFFLLVFLMRGSILNFFIERMQSRFLQRHNVVVNVGNAGFEGLKTIVINDVLMVPEGRDTLMKVSSVRAELSIKKLLRLRPGFSSLVVDSAIINLVKRDSVNNFLFLMRPRASSEPAGEQSNEGVSYRKRFSSLMQNITDFFDEEIAVKQLRVSFTDGRSTDFFSVPELYFDGENLKSSVVTSSADGVSIWYITGSVNHESEEYSLFMKRESGQEISLPFIGYFDNARLSFDSASMKFASAVTGDVARIDGFFNMHGLKMHHWRIAREDVEFPDMQFAVRGFIADDSIGISPGTVLQVKELPVRIALSYSRKPERRLRLDAGFMVDDADRLFDALPKGMFYTFRGFRARGELDYRFRVDLPLDRPDSLVFDPVMKKKNFRIINYGTENFSKISLPFSYICMDGERPLRSFQVGPENPFFTPLASVSPYLQDAVLTAEDPSFFRHSGFLEEAFRESIITNIKKRRFARGGSTISMQLVKNVFLSRNKSISRKLEEIMIVWIIEQQRLVSKERMFEVYLNIIEWGPDVYGIGEASRFYFNKLPSELNLEESIFLSSLIPNPKYVKYRFDENGRLKPFMANYFKLIAGRMARRERISQAEADSLRPEILLKGKAMEFVQPADSLLPDLQEDELVPAIKED